MKRERIHHRIARRLGYELIPWRKNHLQLEPHLAKLFRRHGVNGLLDAGANNGQYAKRMRTAGFTGPIFSFEPLPSAFARLAEAANEDPLWHPLHFALGKRSGRLPLHVAGEAEFSSFLVPSAYGREQFGIEAAGDEEVEVRRLDEVLGDLTKGMDDPRLFLKMDTQGWDLEVFKGARGSLDRIVGLQSELALKPIYENMPSFLSMLSAYREAGYEITGLFPVNRDRASLAVIEYDCVLVRAD